ncbi:L-histidine N(alpha)-methyltransferase [Herbaspirillum seropedicae]|nr:L-histidine N(alpha)-methyltransferase [Herbaspirillum sp. alder98]MCA1324713.1 L-histidine N(alpha)-methyltransferase [Herbaspirillum sp. alder98]
MPPLSQAAPEPTIRAELEAGLLAPQAVVSPKYLYDALGSKLFEAICELPEYYPTRTEASIFEAHASSIAATVGQGVTLIDLGAGNCAKAARLFPLLQPRQYVPVDISADFLHEAVASLRQKFPGIAIDAIAQDFSSSLNLPATVSRERRLFFYPGSSLGNFDPDQALQFLRRLRQALQLGEAGGVLLGIDLVKPAAVLDAAYDDALGVTAAFNLNLLNHVNRLLGADFNARHWQHLGFYNAAQQRVEMHLEARRDVIVRWEGGRRTFGQGERIHTENSHKFTPDGIVDLLQRAGFGDCRMWFDPQRWFAVCHARAR